MNIQTFTTTYGTMTTFRNDPEFYHSLQNGKFYEQDIVINHIIPLFKDDKENINDKIILDIGSHIGSHTILYSKLIDKCQIYCFEPQRPIFELLQKNINDNHLTNCKLFHNAVGHKIIDTTMSSMIYDGYDCLIDYNTNKHINYGGIGLGQNGQEIKMITIDSLNLERCDYIKIDVEGAEILAFMGAVETIKKYKPFIMFEKTDKIVSNEMKNSLSIDFEPMDTNDFLKNLGYSFKNIDSSNILAMPNN
jgi:FkbM family methyltransferase